MKKDSEHLIDAEMVQALGLQLSPTPLTAEAPIAGRVYKYPQLENVYIMERDLYGNLMPEGSCFLAFNGHHGLMGKRLKLATLKRFNAEDIKKVVREHNEG
jgi:hypothetical protein